MSDIEKNRKQLFEFLYKWYESKKVRDDEQYFKIDQLPQPGVPQFPLSSHLRNPGSFRIFFYGDWLSMPIAYLMVSQKSELFLVGQIDNKILSSLQDNGNALKNYFEHRLNDFQFVSKEQQGESIEYVYAFKSTQKLIDQIRFFLDKIKPEIDQLIAPLKQNTRFSYLFFNRVQFEDYLKFEPYYSPTPISAKTNLALKMLRVQNFKGIKSLLLDDLPSTARWIILTGENGYGKTSVLQAIAAGLYGAFDETGTELVPGSAFVGVEYYANGEIIETNSRTPTLDSTNRQLKNELATYGSARLRVTASVAREVIEQQAPTTYHLFNSDGLLLNIEQYLKDAYSFNRPNFDRVVNLFKDLLPNLATIDIALVNKIPEVRYFEQDETGRPLTSGLTFSQLASGYKNIIAMIGDLVYRLSTRQDVDDFSELEGIVIIDELELHLHPRYQKRFPEILTRHFPNLQFIASTHSPIPLLGVPKDTVLLHVTRNEERGITVERLDVDFSVLTPNAILSSPIFGFKDLIPESKSDGEMIRSETTYQELVENQQTQQKVDSFLSPDKQQELLRLLTTQ